MHFLCSWVLHANEVCCQAEHCFLIHTVQIYITRMNAEKFLQLNVSAVHHILCIEIFTLEE